MRITSGTIVRRYTKNLENSMFNKNTAENKITSNRRFSRASDDPINAARALRIRKSMNEFKTYEDNLNTAKSIYADAETAMRSVSDLIKSTYEKLIYGANGTQSNDEDQILSNTIDTYADEMVRLMNVVVADRKIFGGTNNDSLAFTIEKSAGGSTVFYNGKSVNAYQDPSLFPYSSTSYTDIGIGMRLLEDGSVDPQSAFPVTFNGAEVLGCGLKDKITTFDFNSFVDGGSYSLDVALGGTKKTITFSGGATNDDTRSNLNTALESAFGVNTIKVEDNGVAFTTVLGDVGLTFENTPLKKTTDPSFVNYDQADFTETPVGYSNNIIQLTLDAAACLRSGDKEGAAKYADALFKIQTNLLLKIADVGNKDEFIDFNLDRVTNSLYTLSEQQNNTEYTDLGTEITNWKVMDALYNATLQMSAQIIPMSIFNFM